MELIKRQSIIIWLYSTKNIKQLRKHGYIHYFSKRMKYAVMYVDKNEAEEVIERLKSYYFVRDVELSYRDSIDMTFSGSLESDSKEILEDDLFIAEEDDQTLIESIAKSLKENLKQDKDI